jgi:xylulokinase
MLVGGGASNAAWARMLASAFGLRIEVPSESAAAGALGAARLAWLAAGGDPAEICRRPDVAREFLPDASEAALLHARHAQFRSLYPALARSFKAGPQT